MCALQDRGVNVLRGREGMMWEMTEAEMSAHIASYAVPALLTDDELCSAWREHWNQFSKWATPAAWFERHRELLAESNHRGFTLSRFKGKFRAALDK